MRVKQEGNALIIRKEHETLRIEPWGRNSLRIRATKNAFFTEKDWALQKPDQTEEASIQIDGQTSSICSGKILAEINDVGLLTFYRLESGKKQRILHEFRRNYYGSQTDECFALKYEPRVFKGIAGDEWSIQLRLEANENEKIYGMGQYQQPLLNLKGALLELSQRNSQISIPFYLSSLNYGFLWNHPGVGRAFFGTNVTEFTADTAKELDYWITVGDTPREILETYTAMTARPPKMDESLLGLWQSKLRYRTQEEVLEVGRRYHELGVPLDVIIIDFFHFMRQGDWNFDEKYWPDVKGMVEELRSYGTEVMISVWPTVDKKSENFGEMNELGYLLSVEHGSHQSYDWQGDCLEVDVFNPEARKYWWDICKKNYYDQGIRLFWLDNIEPDLAVYDYENFRYYGGSHLECGNLYPLYCEKAFYDGLKEQGEKEICLLSRSAWASAQKYGTMLWSGDIQSNFNCLKTQVIQGMNVGIAGFGWWNTDIGGFITDDWHDPDFIELLIRWFEYGIFTPIVRLHGTRGPLDIEPLDDRDFGGGFLYTGHDNEIWSYGEQAQKIFEKFLRIREQLKPYLCKIYKEASETGLPLIRALFIEFPEDEKSWEIKDEYMFGSSLLVAPVLELHARSRKVYLPAGTWEEAWPKQVIEGGREITVDAPIDEIPLFIRRK